MDKISIIVPCYNEEDALPAFYRAASDAVRDIDGVEYEFIFVDDGSTDHTPDILESLSLSDDRCRSLSFSRNFVLPCSAMQWTGSCRFHPPRPRSQA